MVFTRNLSNASMAFMCAQPVFPGPLQGRELKDATAGIQ